LSHIALKKACLSADLFVEGMFTERTEWRAPILAFSIYVSAMFEQQPNDIHVRLSAHVITGEM
jgi:hypothetical protein